MVGWNSVSARRPVRHLFVVGIVFILVVMAYRSFRTVHSVSDLYLEDAVELDESGSCPVAFDDIANKFYTSSKEHVLPTDGDCTMETCFNASKCAEQHFRVYVYAVTEPVSEIYTNVLSALRRSPYFTENPDEACLFVLGLDTMERDSLSNIYVKNMNEKMHVDPIIQQYWNGGRNHIIFNLKAGTFPYYHEKDLGFDIGFAVLAKASMSFTNFRRGFDVSLPLFQSSLPPRGEDPGYVVTRKSRFATRKYRLSFKGKRYLYGIGSDGRNFLYHINNQQDILILTTCEHGKLSRSIRDERCDDDDQQYIRYDYQMLLNNSTFCLVPRGRRLDSFRFLEALQAGCIPVILSNGIVLPFSEIIDWKKAVLFADERRITHIPTMIRSIKYEQVVAMRQQTQLLWRQYFSSVERIALTTLEIVRSRFVTFVPRHRTKNFWNEYPAAFLSHIPYLSHHNIIASFPHVDRKDGKFTVHITIVFKNDTHSNLLLERLLKSLNRTPSVGYISIMTDGNRAMEKAIRSWTWLNVPYNIISDKKLFLHEVKTQAVIFVQDDCELTSEDLEQSFQLWETSPGRIVGPHSASHSWDEFTGRWQYLTKNTGDYSMVTMKDAFVHVQYHVLLRHYQEKVAPKLPVFCSDILLNFIAATVSKLPPLMTERKLTNQVELTDGTFSEWAEVHRQQRDCLNQLYEKFGYMPLVRSTAVEEALFPSKDFHDRRWNYTS